MLIAVHEFADKLKAAAPDAIGFLYYAGHGVAVGNDNVVVPVNVQGTSRRELEISGVRLGETIGILNEGAPQAVHFVVFDACRNLAGGRGTRGFVPVAERPGMLIAFSTAPNTAASDGEGKSSGPYAAALASELVAPGRYHGDMFFEVRTKVANATRQ